MLMMMVTRLIFLLGLLTLCLASSDELLGADEAARLLMVEDGEGISAAEGQVVQIESPPDLMDKAVTLITLTSTKTILPTTSPSTSSSRTSKTSSRPKNVTIITTVTPPTACSTDGCCPKSPTTVTVTAMVTSTDSYIYTVTETIDVTVFRGVTESVLSVGTVTSQVTLVSTFTLRATVTTTSFLTTLFPIERTFYSTVRFFTPAVRTVQRNFSSTNIIFSITTNTSEVVLTELKTDPATITIFQSVGFTTTFLTYTQIVFNPLTTAVVTSYFIFTYSRTTTDVDKSPATRTSIETILVGTATLSIPSVLVIPVLTQSTTIQITTAVNYIAVEDVATTITYSRIL